MSIHDLDFIIHLFGKIGTIYAIGKKDEVGCYNFTMTSLEYKVKSKGKYGNSSSYIFK